MCNKDLVLKPCNSLYIYGNETKNRRISNQINVCIIITRKIAGNAEITYKNPSDDMFTLRFDTDVNTAI